MTKYKTKYHDKEYVNADGTTSKIPLNVDISPSKTCVVLGGKAKTHKPMTESEKKNMKAIIHIISSRI